MAEKLEQYLGTGRRKASVARIYLRPGKGRFVVNGRDIKEYFGNVPRFEEMSKSPLETANAGGKYDVIVNVVGGGPSGQAGAIRHGLSRALVTASEGNRSPLKRAGFLTRDARVVERKKPGKPGARKSFQFSKR